MLLVACRFCIIFLSCAEKTRWTRCARIGDRSGRKRKFMCFFFLLAVNNFDCLRVFSLLKNFNYGFFIDLHAIEDYVKPILHLLPVVIFCFLH